MSLDYTNKANITPHLKTSSEFREHFLSKFNDLEHINLVQMEDKFGDEFFNSAQNFILELLAHIKLKLPFQDIILTKCEILQLKDMTNKTKNNWISLARYFKRKVDYSAFISEFDIF